MTKIYSQTNTTARLIHCGCVGFFYISVRHHTSALTGSVLLLKRILKVKIIEVSL